MAPRKPPAPVWVKPLSGAAAAIALVAVVMMPPWSDWLPSLSWFWRFFTGT